MKKFLDSEQINYLTTKGVNVPSSPPDISFFLDILPKRINSTYILHVDLLRNIVAYRSWKAKKNKFGYVQPVQTVLISSKKKTELIDALFSIYCQLLDRGEKFL